MHRSLSYSILLVGIFMAFASEGVACSCGEEPIPPGVTIEQFRQKRREYFLNEFKGAAFVGKIVNRERIRIDRDVKAAGGEEYPYEHYYRYTIRVKEHWFGVNSRSVYVYGEPDKYPMYDGVVWGSSSCGFKLKTGRTYFFTPQLYDGLLHIGLCDFAGGGSDPLEGRVVEFTKIMGQPKRF
jgi:hypothetical protein